MWTGRGSEVWNVTERKVCHIVVEYTQNRARSKMGSTYPVDCETRSLSSAIFSSRLLLVARVTEFYARLIQCFFAENALSQLSIKTLLLIFCADDSSGWAYLFSCEPLCFSPVFLFFFFFLEDPHKTDRTNRINLKQVRCNWSHHVCTVCINKQLLGGRNGVTGKLQIQRWMLWLRAPCKHLYVTQERVWESV